MKDRLTRHKYDIPDIEEDLPFLPESMKKQRLSAEDGEHSQKILTEKEASIEAIYNNQDCSTPFCKSDKTIVEAIYNDTALIGDENDEDVVEHATWSERKYIILIIYDIISNKQRVKMAKLLSGYGNRVQKSAFEARLDKKRYARLLKDIKKLLKPDDNVRIYKLHSYEEIKTFGDKKYEVMEDVIVI